MIILVFVAQILKYIYDGYAGTELERIANASDFLDMRTLYRFNSVCMLVDSIIICMDSFSLLKYTQIALPELNTITYTFVNFITGTFKKTLTMIILTYVLFGLMSRFILCFYQYGFFYSLYALLRSCIVFLNGFIINEQQILLSRETVENLIVYNGFFITFSTLVIVNILIRQMMINIIAIFMHSDYHKAK